MIPFSRPLHVEIVPLSEVPVGESASFEEEAPVILVIESERLIADTLSTILAKTGFSTATAYDGETGLELARKIVPAILIADAGLPGMNGIALATAVADTIPGCRILLLSSDAATTEQIAEASAKGYDFPFLQRPVHPTVLVHRVSELMSSRRPTRPATPSSKQAIEVA